MLHLLAIIFLSLISSSSHSHGASPCNRLDHDSLLSFISTTSSSSSPPLNWSSSVDCCEWDGIRCNLEGSVTHLQLPSKRLDGILTSNSLSNLKKLTHLDLSHNRLHGNLDNNMFMSLSLLRILDLSYNEISGEIPSALLGSGRVESIDLSSNKLEGVIFPSILDRAGNLTVFNVSNNGLSGALPRFVQNSVSVLDFSHNNFRGRIFSGIGNCSKLKIFRAGYNNLSGSIPDDIYNATSLEEISIIDSLEHLEMGRLIFPGSELSYINLHLDLSSNQFTSSIPDEIGNLANLEIFILQKNNLSGFLPSSLVNCSNLVTLNLRGNFLEGEISNFNFSAFLNLRVLDIGMNSFFGYFPVSLYSCRKLSALRLSRNHLEGQILPDILELQFLSFLSVADNKLTNISGAIGILKNAKRLQVLMLTLNFFDEPMPNAELDGFENLKHLSLRGCNLHGPVPIWLAKLKRLQYLNLAFNRITGAIPEWLWTLPELYYVDLSANLISGKLTSGVSRLSALVKKNPDENIIELPILVQVNGTFNEYNQLSYLPRILYLQNNTLSGIIPIEIGDLKLLQYLDLSTNKFSGPIPSQLSNLTNLEELYLSGNHLSGKIPDSLKSLTFLARFSVANNDLEGEVLSGGQLDTFTSSSFDGNQMLCGQIVKRVCNDDVNPRSSVGSTTDDDGFASDEFLLGIVGGIGFGFVVGAMGGLLYPVHKILLVRRRGWEEYVPLQWLELRD